MRSCSARSSPCTPSRPPAARRPSSPWCAVVSWRRGSSHDQPCRPGCAGVSSGVRFGYAPLHVAAYAVQCCKNTASPTHEVRVHRVHIRPQDGYHSLLAHSIVVVCCCIRSTKTGYMLLLLLFNENYGKFSDYKKTGLSTGGRISSSIRGSSIQLLIQP